MIVAIPASRHFAGLTDCQEDRICSFITTDSWCSVSFLLEIGICKLGQHLNSAGITMLMTCIDSGRPTGLETYTGPRSIGNPFEIYFWINACSRPLYTYADLWNIVALFLLTAGYIKCISAAYWYVGVRTGGWRTSVYNSLHGSFRVTPCYIF